jgi:hypothetical protein
MADDEPKSMDISKPGNKAPNKTSRPLISTHKMVQDPMVKDDKTESAGLDSDGEPIKKQVPLASTGKVIAPLNPDEVKEEDKTADASQENTEPEESTEEDKKTEPPEANPDAEAKEEAAIVDAVVDQATEDKHKDPGNQDVEDLEKKKLTDKMIEEKKYFLPIGEVTRRKQNKRALFVLIPLLVLVVLYMLADAGIVSAPFELPVEFIR